MNDNNHKAVAPSWHQAWLWPALFSLLAFAANSIFCRLALTEGGQVWAFGTGQDGQLFGASDKQFTAAPRVSRLRPRLAPRASIGPFTRLAPAVARPCTGIRASPRPSASTGFTFRPFLIP